MPRTHLGPLLFVDLAGIASIGCHCVCFASALAVSGCTSGALCDAEHPCPNGWECLDNRGLPVTKGECGQRYPTPLCNGSYCTRTCQRGEETGSLNPGDCPEPYVDCSQGGDLVNEQMVCGASGLGPGLTECSHTHGYEDCIGVELVVWME
ncbi:hypothetical protein ACFL6C_08835 [Myxococcota bacterium]